MPKLGRVAPSVPVSDLERALKFYRDLLGFEILFTNGEPAAFAVIRQGTAELHVGVQPAKAGSLHAHMMIDGLDTMHERLLQAGADIRQPPTVQPWGLRDMIIADPDGNTYEVAEPVG